MNILEERRLTKLKEQYKWMLKHGVSNYDKLSVEVYFKKVEEYLDLFGFEGDRWVLQLGYALANIIKEDTNEEHVKNILNGLLTSLVDSVLIPISIEAESKSTEVDGAKYIDDLIVVLGEKESVQSELLDVLTFDNTTVNTIDLDSFYSDDLDRVDIFLLNMDNREFVAGRVLSLLAKGKLSTIRVIGLTDSKDEELLRKLELRNEHPNLVNVFNREDISIDDHFKNEVWRELQMKLIQKDKEYKDELTGLYNRKYFNDVISSLNSKGTKYTVGIIDIDKFKSVNDTYGHLCGDYVLRETAKFLLEETREFAFLFRLGGEEFALLVPNKDENESFELVNRVRESYSYVEFSYEEFCFKRTFSCGLSYDEAKDTKYLLETSDSALYQAKNEGRNLIRVYSEFSDKQKKKDMLIVISGFTPLIRRSVSNKLGSFTNAIVELTDFDESLIPEYKSLVFYNCIPTKKLEITTPIIIISNETTEYVGCTVISTDIRTAELRERVLQLLH